jgi:hypothetical protein
MDMNTTLMKIPNGGTSDEDCPVCFCQVVSAFYAGMCARKITKTVLIIDYPFIVAAVELGEAHQCRQQ